MNLLKRLKSKSGTLLSNMLLLSLLQFSTLALGFVTTGYQNQLLGKDFGYLAIAQIYMTFIQLLIDFGFALSATGKAAKFREDRAYLGRQLSCVMLIKMALSLFSALILAVFLWVRQPELLVMLTFWLYYLSVVLMAMLPDYLYRGLERMGPITLRAVSIKIFATVMILVFMKSKNDYYMTPLFNSIGNFVALFLVYRHLKEKIGIWFLPVKWPEIWQEAKDSFQFFASRIATTIYGAVNGMILDLLNPTMKGSVTIFYNNANQVVGAARNGLISPIADSMYPHMMRHKNFSMIKKALKITMPVMILGCTAVYFIADPVFRFWLGEVNGPGSARALQALLPVVVISLPSYILGFPTLSPMGLSKYANRSINVGTVFHLAGLALLYFSGNLALIPICLLTGGTELMILLYRIAIVVKYRHLLQPGTDLPGGERQAGGEKA